ncbi:MAG: RNA pseudouridine synthase [Bacteroidales bacterium]|jgi:23S rRNA pseudouridine1911/1915/1917 synthase|nr:RNA pseudouridine synthase [Bacteroidales bacterium]
MLQNIEKQIIYEDNHIIVINKLSSQIVQGDKTGDEPLVNLVKNYLKHKYNKSGNVFCGVVHRLDRPVSGAVIFAKTDKALSRLNNQIKERQIEKTYWAITRNAPPKERGTLQNYLIRNERQNKSYITNDTKEGQYAELDYYLLAKSDFYNLLEINLKTGRHHQIRVQLAAIGCPIRGDLKYGFGRSNRITSISLHARKLSFLHPVSKKQIDIIANVPDEPLWNYFLYICNKNNLSK